VLDVGCRSGGPDLYLVHRFRVQVTGVDSSADAIASAVRQAERVGLATQTHFVQADASRPLPLPVAAFGAILCIDAVGWTSTPQPSASWPSSSIECDVAQLCNHER